MSELYSRDSVLRDIFECRLKNAAGVIMKLEIRGEELDENFMKEIIGMLTFSDEVSKNAFKIICELVKKRLYIELFKKKDVMTSLISLLKVNLLGDNTRIRNQAEIILRMISEIRPGIVINYYIKNRNIFKPTQNSFNESLEYFEEFVMKLSESIANKNMDYDEKYHTKVREIYDGHWSIQRHMQ